MSAAIFTGAKSLDLPATTSAFASVITARPDGTIGRPDMDETCYMGEWWYFSVMCSLIS